VIGDLEHAKNQVAYYRAQCSVAKIGSGFHLHLAEQRGFWERMVVALEDSALLDTVQTRGLAVLPPVVPADPWEVRDPLCDDHTSEGTNLREAIRAARAAQVPQ
jgi:hypothetical protein